MIRRQAGFTLIEIMIAMAILAIISVLSAQTMKAGIQDREAVQNEIASDAKVADAMRIIRTDVNAVYHYRDLFIAIQNAAIKTPAANAPNGAAPPAAPAGFAAPGTNGFGQVPGQPPVANAEPEATPRPTPPDVTGFIGDSQSMYFTTLSNVRTIQDSQVSDQAKIGYYLKSCTIRASGDKKIPSKCLYRSLSPYLDENVDKPGDETMLLDHVDQFKLRYLGPGRGTSTDLEYVDTWKTGKNGDAISKLNFPYAVEVTISTDNKDDAKAKRVTASALIPIRFPNNPPKQKNGQPATEESVAAEAQAAAQQAAQQNAGANSGGAPAAAGGGAPGTGGNGWGGGPGGTGGSGSFNNGMTGGGR